MPPLSPEDIDAQAGRAAASEQEQTATEPAAAGTTPTIDRPTLAYGASGANVVKLIDLLSLLGHKSADHAPAGSSRDLQIEPTAVLDEALLLDVRSAQAALDVVEPALADFEGEFVGQATWCALYNAAAAKLEAQQAS